ncbi:MAG: FMN-binding glutamate synthase family protein [Fimbriimonadales bacterium]|nr:MAG: FMN-binding glutamate synthase family protein [Fimbriimonadales bacterium]
MRREFFYSLGVVTVLELLAAFFYPGALWSLIVVIPLAALGLYDAFQKKHTILRTFPLLGHGRFLFELVRPEIQQYFIETNIDAHPIEREMRSVVYQRAKGELETKPFGTERDVYRVGYEWAAHSLAPSEKPSPDLYTVVGSSQCEKKCRASLLNISAMSYGALSSAAVRALNEGAAIGGFLHNTGEGGVSPHHLAGGGKLVWQIGTGYFGCRTPDGQFDADKFAEKATLDNVAMIEVKLSQGAKPGHGGVLPGEKVSPEIAQIRGVPVGQTVISPPRHSAFQTPIEMLEFLQRLRELSGGKPVGFKLCIGREREFLAICKAIRETGIYPDFVTVDGGEGGTGAAPLEFSNSIGMPARDAWVFARNALVGAGLKDEIKLFVSGKILTGFHVLRALALGADACNSARGFMLALGCIQALRCNTNKCPTGVATQDPWLVQGLVVEDKRLRVARYHEGTLKSLCELMYAMSVSSPSELDPSMIYRRTSETRVASYAELYEYLQPGSLLDQTAPERWLELWQAADPRTFGPPAPSA